ncbi:MAG: hypothetical protein ACK5Y6_05205 [Pseudomonadota bacterium]|jgi:hypothetical protein
MGGIISKITDFARSRSKAEWQALVEGYWLDLKEYARANGEKAAVIGFALGIFIVVFYKLALLLACLAVLVYQLLLLIADQD